MHGLKTHRWNRIFGEDGKSLIFAMDHAAAFGLMEGLERPGQVIRKVREGGADAILTTYGISTRFADEIGAMGLILRVDGGSTLLAEQRGPMRLVYDVYDALRIGADAVGAMGMPGSRFEAETPPCLPVAATASLAGGAWTTSATTPEGRSTPPTCPAQGVWPSTCCSKTISSTRPAMTRPLKRSAWPNPWSVWCAAYARHRFSGPT